MRHLLLVTCLAALAACGAKEPAKAPAPVAAAPAPAPVPVAAPAVVPAAAAAVVAPPAVPTIPKKPLTILATGDDWGEYSPCG